MKADDTSGICLRVSFVLALTAACLFGGVGCQSSSMPQAAGKEAWVPAFQNTYPDWDNPKAQDETRYDKKVAWSYQIRAAYPDWEPHAKRTDHNQTSAPKSVKKQTPAETRRVAVPPPAPAPASRSAQKVEPPRTARPSASTRAVSPAGETPGWIPVDEVGTRKSAAPAPAPVKVDRKKKEMTPSDHQEFVIIPDGSKSTPPAAKKRFYTVKRGDTLAGIAEKFYGDADAWRTIRDANPYIIRNPRHLTIGATLVIP